MKRINEILKYFNVLWILNTRYCILNIIEGKFDFCWFVFCLFDFCIFDFFYLIFVCLIFVYRLILVGRWLNIEKSFFFFAIFSCLRYFSCFVNYCRLLSGILKVWIFLMIYRYVDDVCIWICKSDLKWDIIVIFLCICKYYLKVCKKYDCFVNFNFKIWLNFFIRGLKFDNLIIWSWIMCIWFFCCSTVWFFTFYDWFIIVLFLILLVFLLMK